MIFLKATVHLMPMGLAVLKLLTVLLPLDVTGLHRKSILGAVTSVMSLLKTSQGAWSPPGAAPAFTSKVVTCKALILCHDLALQLFQSRALLLSLALGD